MENKLIVAILLLVAGLLGVGHLISFQGFQAVESDLEQQFQEFQWKYNKVYNNEAEEQKRFSLFKKTVEFINKFNAEGHSSKVAINKFADLTDMEYESLLNLKVNLKKKERIQRDRITNRPSKVDWRGTLVWTGVYDQGQCGSCWAFSSVQSLEGAYAKEYDKFVQLSVQEILDCAEGKYGNLGCNGGLMDPVFEWVQDNGGICSKEEYAHTEYTAKVQECVKDSCTNTLQNIDGFYDVPKNNKEAFLNRLAIVPLAIAIDASQTAFKYYATGIIEVTSFGRLNHAVLAVGYDEDEGYILGKNSWADTWGDKGYFKLKLTSSGRGTLGVYMMASYPTYPGEPEP